MAPNISIPTGVLQETDADVSLQAIPEIEKTPSDRKLQLVWRNVILFAYLHLAALYGGYLLITVAKWPTVIQTFLFYVLSGLGITAGAHRLWSHRSYKATWQLRLLLTIFNTLAFQNSVIEWAKDHRVHHKYSETDADPHNSKRGFFFSHVGWLLCRKHPEVIKRGKGIDFSDLHADPILHFQHKYYLIVMPLITFILPTAMSMYFWNETFQVALFANLFRYTFALNCTWLVNSAAHFFGHKPYDQFIKPAENLSVAMLALGEGWHNYHHTFPWDYKTSELGKYSTNITCIFIDLMARIGWAYDMKTVSTDMIRQRIQRTGDGTHEIWGWGDKDQQESEKQGAVIINSTKESEKVC